MMKILIDYVWIAIVLRVLHIVHRMTRQKLTRLQKYLDRPQTFQVDRLAILVQSKPFQRRYQHCVATV